MKYNSFEKKKRRRRIKKSNFFRFTTNKLLEVK